MNNNLDSIREKIIRFFVLITLVIFPLFYREYYFDILSAKYQFYYTTSIFMLLSILALSLLKIFQNKESHWFAVPKILLCEYAVIVFASVAIISTLQSDYVFESFWGNEGRLTGLFLLLIYVLNFFLISKFLTVKQYLLDAFLLSGSAVGIWGITDYFQLDIMGFKALMLDAQKAVFFSSMGNINTYTAFLGMVLAVASVLYLLAKNNIKRSIVYYLCIVISFVAIITGNSDNAYLSIGTLFVFAPLFCCNTESRIRRYAVICATFFSALQLVDWINFQWSDQVIGLNSLFSILANSKMLLPVVILSWGVITIWYIARRNACKEKNGYQGNTFRNIWLLLIVCLFAVIIYLLYDCNFNGNIEKYGSLSSYLYFDEHWGSDRGAIWQMAMKYFNDFPPFRKIVGYGPDTFGILMVNNDKARINQTGVVLDNAHNEYLQMLITMGIAGVVSYISFIIGALKRMIKNGTDNPAVMASVFAVLCYSAQALVNIGLPITSPFMWLFLAIGIAGCRDR